MYRLHQELVLKEPEEKYFTLLAAGSGFGYIMDVLGILAHKYTPPAVNMVPHVDIHFAIRCRAFIRYMAPEIDEMMELIHSKQSAHVNFNVYITEKKDNTFLSGKWMKVHEGEISNFNDNILNQ